MDMQMAGPSGNYVGHWLPGTVFLAWGLWWTWRSWSSEGHRPPHAPVEWDALVPVLKLLAVPVGIWTELPGRDWFPQDYLMGLHHITIYLGFGLSGVVDLLARRGRLSHRATYFALAGASWLAALIFAGHGNHPGVESTGHRLIAWSFTGLGVVAVAEVFRPLWGLHWVRAAAMTSLGGWFIVVGWMLFRSGWDLHDPLRDGWVHLLFAWTLLAAASLTLACRLTARRAAAPSPWTDTPHG